MWSRSVDALKCGTLCTTRYMRQTCKCNYVINVHVTNVILGIAGLCVRNKVFTHIIQLWHDGSASPHFKFKEVEYFLRVAQWLQDIHVASGAQLLFCKLAEMSPIHADASPRCSSSSTIKRILLSISRLVRSTDTTDWLASHGLSGECPMSEQSVWCDAPPK